MESVDVVMRRLYHVQEYDQSGKCLFRIALRGAKHAFTLRDGTRIEPGMPLGDLHLWNEHLPRFGRSGADLGWAKALLKRAEFSLEALARFVQDDPAWAEVQAFGGALAVPFRPRATKQLRFVAEEHGFGTPFEFEGTPGALAVFAESVRTWSFCKAYNPAACLHSPFLRGRQDLWLSRSTLLARYGACPTRAGSWAD
jgi:hypothetical protein